MEALLNAAANFDIEGIIVSVLMLGVDAIVALTAWLTTLVRWSA